MGKVILPRHFIFSVLLLLVLLGLYVFSEARRLQAELLRQTEAKGVALAEAMATNIRSAILGNALLEELIGQRLIDNARLIDELLRFPPVDQQTLQQVAAMNRLQKIELLDVQGKPVEIASRFPGNSRMEEMRARMRKLGADPSAEEHRPMGPFMWGRRWRLHQDQTSPLPKIAERKFWEGSVFGVAIGSRSFPGIVAVHANADYILNFRKEIDVQKQIEELGRQPGIDHVALLEKDGKIIAHSETQMIPQRSETAPALLALQPGGAPLGRIETRSDGTRHYDIVKALDVRGSNIGWLEIGLSLDSMEAARRQSLRSMLIFGLAILAVGIFGMAAIFYNQQSQLRKIASLEAELGRQERLSELGNLAATVAHEIRNPLNSVSMGLQRLQAEFTPTEEPDDYARFLKLMQEEVHRLNSIVEQFLSLARPLEINREVIFLDGFLKELTALLAGQADAARVKIELQLSPNLPPLHADRNYLKQLLLNLILNGIQAMPEGGALTIAACAVKDRLELTVADQGTGIKPAAMKNIFEPYFTTKASGSGLGLAIARRIVEAHRGTITAASEPGRGSRFRLSLPLKPAEA